MIATHVSPGDRVRPGEVLVEVADYGEIEIRASVPASVGVTLRERMTAGYEISAVAEVDGRRVGLAMVRLAGDVKRGQTGVDAFFKPAGSDAPQIDIGRVVNLHIVLPAEQNVVALPVQSIYENDRVYRIVDSRLEALQVEQVGDYLDDAGKHYILVRGESLRPGDHLVTTQLPRAISGLLVAPVDASEMPSILDASQVASMGAGTP